MAVLLSHVTSSIQYAVQLQHVTVLGNVVKKKSVDADMTIENLCVATYTANGRFECAA